MRIAIIGSRGYPYVYSGYETFVSELANRLQARGHQVLVYCHSNLFKQQPQTVNGISLRYLPSLETKILSQLSHSLLATIDVLFRKTDIVLYVNSANGPFGLLLKIGGKRTCINVDGLEWLRPKWKGLGARYFRFSSYLATKLFDTVITDSDRMADIYKKEFSSESVTIAYGANPGHSENPGLLKQFNLEPQTYYLVVGRLVPDNNADLIVDGFQKCSSAKKLVVLGDVPYRDQYAESIKEKALRDPRILFPGYVKDPLVLKELYCNCHAYLHGHEFGGTNPSLLKALAYGCCVLALDTQFNREVLAEDRHGIYFQKNSESLQALIEQCDTITDFISQKRAISRERIAEKYTWERITDQYEELFRGMME